MAQVWETLVAEKNVWTPSFRRGSAAVCMVMTVMMLGLLGMDMLGGTGKVVLSMFPVYMIAYVLLASLAFAVLSAVFLRRLDGGKELPWPRLGGMLMAMVLVKAYIVYSQYMITWYASIPAEMSFITQPLPPAGPECLPRLLFFSFCCLSLFCYSPR